MIVRKVVYNNRCSCCGALLTEEWVSHKDRLKEAFVHKCWRRYAGRDYCHDCWQRNPDGSVTTKDGCRYETKG